MVNRKSVLAVVAALAGCAAPAWDEPGMSKVVQEGRVQPERVLAFVDCIVERFDRTPVTIQRTRERQLADGTRRVQVMQDNTTIAAVDVSKSGNAQLVESYVGEVVGTEMHRTAFAECLGKVGGKP